MKEKPISTSLSEDIHETSRQTGMTPREVTDYLLQSAEIIQKVNRTIKMSDTDELGKLKDALKGDDPQRSS